MEDESMPFLLEVFITAPFKLGDVLARVELDDGNRIFVILRDGIFKGKVPIRPLKITLTPDPAPKGQPPPRLPAENTAGSPGGLPVDVHTLLKKDVKYLRAAFLRYNSVGIPHTTTSEFPVLQRVNDL